MSDHERNDGGELAGFSPYVATENDFAGPYIPGIRDCMSCGMCISTCPTYQVRPEENYGPRGRVRLIERVVRKADVLAQEEMAALEACVLCRACEVVCPSKMDYAGLYRQAIDSSASQAKQTVTIKLLLRLLVPSRRIQKIAVGLIHFYQKSGIQRLLEALPFPLLKGELRQLHKLLPAPFVSQTVPRYSRNNAAVFHGEVDLFTGCMGNIFDTDTHNATIKVLTQLGYDVRVPENPVCCGAIHAHNGEPEQAKSYARKNLATITAGRASAIIYNASACGAFLSEYPVLLGEETREPGQTTAPAVLDIMAFLRRTGRLAELEFTPLRARVAVHEPCSQRNILKNHEVVYEVLARIPGLEIIPLPENTLCCGAGGTKLLTQPEFAEPLRDRKIRALAKSGAGILVSTNLTCALHLSSGIRELGCAVEVMHPVRLLAQQLK